ncbi:hypothetical protein B296_00025277 [Ensete ventricosum]|uniref:Transcription factor CBF/NF-Y/archaeal histone domain-containing protein n=1 Tax=Ensete ventricosum TaxID=4639 RepID=A0A426ZDB6_ENSVE|nr:hypothetical protein B296_00025277 [Ensete ventricosum]
MADSDNESGGHNNSGAGVGAAGELSSLREQDRFLPIANVSRIMKKALPANAKISKDAKETVQECVSEFISFITGEASDKCQREKRKTINGDDLLWAMTTLGFEEYVEPLKVYLQRFRETEGEKGAGSSSSSQPQPDGVAAMSMANDAGGFASSGGAAMYGGGMTMMMRQQVYGSPPSSSPYHHHHQLAMAAKHTTGGGSGGGGGSSTSSTGIGRHGRRGKAVKDDSDASFKDYTFAEAIECHANEGGPKWGNVLLTALGFEALGGTSSSFFAHESADQRVTASRGGRFVRFRSSLFDLSALAIRLPQSLFLLNPNSSLPWFFRFPRDSVHPPEF